MICTNRNRKGGLTAPKLFFSAAMIGLFVATVSYAGTGLTATPSQVNLGLIDEGAPAEAVFVIENKGASEVVIQGVKTN